MKILFKKNRKIQPHVPFKGTTTGDDVPAHPGHWGHGCGMQLLLYDSVILGGDILMGAPPRYPYGSPLLPDILMIPCTCTQMGLDLMIVNYPGKNMIGNGKYGPVIKGDLGVIYLFNSQGTYFKGR